MRECTWLAAVVSLGVGVVAQGALLPVADNFVYQGLPALNMVNIGLGDVLTSGRSASGHTTQSYLRFDLSGVTLNPGDTATLRLWVRDNTPDPNSGAPQFGVPPTPAFPATADVSIAASAWTTNGVTWLNRPGAVGGPVASASVSGINQWVEFDVTSAVAGWLANPASNFGFLVSQPTVVTPDTGGLVYVVYNSSRNTGGNAPQLVITPIPEPSSLMVLGGALLLGLRRR